MWWPCCDEWRGIQAGSKAPLWPCGPRTVIWPSLGTMDLPTRARPGKAPDLFSLYPKSGRALELSWPLPGKARISARDMEAIFPFALEGRLQCMLGLSLSFSIRRGKDSCSTYLPCGNRESGAGGALQSLRGACSHQKLLCLPFCVFLIISFLHPKLLCFIEPRMWVQGVKPWVL